MKQTLAFCALLLGGPLLRADLPESYVQFEQWCQGMVAPLVDLMERGKASLPISGPPSDHGEMADRLEAYSRPSLLAAFWLQMEAVPEEKDRHGVEREKVAEWFRQGLILGTDPEHEQYWGHLTNYHQHGVEMALLAIALDVAREHLWDPLREEEKDQVADWLGQMRGNPRYWNNHMFFSILTLEFLREYGYGERGDKATVDYYFKQLEKMHHGGGWFLDGTNESFDHYNAFAFHTYGLWWAWRFGENDPERAERWRSWSREFIRDYQLLFSEEGGHLPFGRSITYRFNSLSIFGLATLNELDVLPLGHKRRTCRKNLEFFLDKPIEQEQGALSLGWVDEFHGIIEPYSCAGSPYWAAKGLFMTLLPPEHPFWTVEEEKLPAEKGDFVRVVEAPAFVIRGIDGTVELINAGNRCSRSAARRYGAWKWGKISYRSGIGFLTTPDNDRYPLDSALTAERPGGEKRYGRHPTIPIAIGRDHLAASYAFGNRNDYFNTALETHVWWKEGWLLVIHHVETYQPTVLKQGGFALGSERPEFRTETRGRRYAFISNGRQATALQALAGYDTLAFDRRLDDTSPRRHLNHPYHLLAYLATGEREGETFLAHLYWSGEAEENGAPWEAESLRKGHWQLVHPVLGKWDLRHAALPVIE
ncbi:MAG: DUF2264 domain-containing protein [Verrucomicrobia bacterium]|jgi:hypothetical protein|nr:DUF2264 domain-containing protein [Verrucomicrobiota bacterium]